MTLYFGPGVLPEYWLSSQKGHSVKDHPLGVRVWLATEQQHPGSGEGWLPPTKSLSEPVAGANDEITLPATSRTTSHIGFAARCGSSVWRRSRAYSRATVPRLLPMLLSLLAEVGGIVYDREVGGSVSGEGDRCGCVGGSGGGVVAVGGGGQLAWLCPKAYDRAIHAVWWSWAGWCGDVAVTAPVDVEGLAARAGLRPSTLRRRPHPRGLWDRRGDHLSIARWEDPSLDTHRERVGYKDYRCSVPAGTVSRAPRYVGTATPSQPEADTAPWSGMGWSHRLQANLYNLRA